MKKLYVRSCTKGLSVKGVAHVLGDQILENSVRKLCAVRRKGEIRFGEIYYSLYITKCGSGFTTSFTYLVVLVHDREYAVHRPGTRPILPCS